METKAPKVSASAAAAAERSVDQQAGAVGRPERKGDRQVQPRAAN